MTRFRAWFNRLRRRAVQALLHRRIFGERSQGRPLADTRIAPSSCLEHEAGLRLGDHVYIGPFNLIEASGGVVIEDGVQITSHCVIVTHSSHRAMRLMGAAYSAHEGRGTARPGWISGSVRIGAYSYIGPHCVIEAGTEIGRGTLVRAGAVVRGRFPEFAVLAGNPAAVVGDTREADGALLARYPSWAAHREAWAGPLHGTTSDRSAPRGER